MREEHIDGNAVRKPLSSEDSDRSAPGWVPDADEGGQGMSKWIKKPTVSCGTILRLRSNVVECQCPNCKRWCLKWEDTVDYDFCPWCVANMMTGGEKE